MLIKSGLTLGESCVEGRRADSRSGGLGFPLRRYTEVFVHGLPRSRTLCENRHSLAAGHGPVCRSG